MRRSREFVLREVAGKYVAVPLGQVAETFRGMITMNKTAKFLWDLLEEEQTEESLIKALIQTYGITEERAAGTVKKFLDAVYPTGAIE
jgi:isocitrate lyase